MVVKALFEATLILERIRNFVGAQEAICAIIIDEELSLTATLSIWIVVKTASRGRAANAIYGTAVAVSNISRTVDLIGVSVEMDEFSLE